MKDRKYINSIVIKFNAIFDVRNYQTSYMKCAVYT